MFRKRFLLLLPGPIGSNPFQTYTVTTNASNLILSYFLLLSRSSVPAPFVWKADPRSITTSSKIGNYSWALWHILVLATQEARAEVSVKPRKLRPD
jgi:hypothetical protein